MIDHIARKLLGTNMGVACAWAYYSIALFTVGSGTLLFQLINN